MPDSRPGVDTRIACLTALAPARTSGLCSAGCPCAEAGVHNCPVKDVDAPKALWAGGFPAGPPDEDALGRLVDADCGRDDAENSYYEAAADAARVHLERARRRFRGQYLRRLRHRAERDRASYD